MIYSTKKLGDVLEKIVGGGTPSKLNPSYWGGDIPWASVKDIKEDIFVLSETKDSITKAGLRNSASNLIPKGTIIISTRMGLGRVVKTEIDTAINQDLKALFPKKELNVDYLLLFLRAKAEDIVQKGSGATVSGVRLEHIKEIEIPLPPLTEQKKIVAKLEKLLAKVQRAKKLRAEAQEATSQLLPAELHKIFEEGKKKGWEENELQEISKVGTGATPLKGNSAYYGGSIPWVTSKSTSSWYIEKADDYITELAVQKTNCKLLPKHTLVVAMYGQGKTRGQVSELLIEATTNQALATFVIDETLAMTGFVKYFLLLNYEKIRTLAEGGPQLNLSLGKLKSMEIFLPSLTKQKNIVARLDSISEKTKQLQEYQKTTSDNFIALEQSILSKAFTGEFV